MVSSVMPWKAAELSDVPAIVHEDNDWGLSCCDDDEEEVAAAPATNTSVPDVAPGLKPSFEVATEEVFTVAE